MRTHILVLILASTLAAASTSATRGEDETGPPTPKWFCCPAAVLEDSPPYDVGCSAECADAVFSDTPPCASEGTSTGPQVNGGQCELSTPPRECAATMTTESGAPSWTCEKSFCTVWLVKCLNLPDEEGADFTYEDCSGSPCWGGK